MKEVNIVAKGAGWEFAPHKGEIWGINDLFYNYYMQHGRHINLAVEMHDYTWNFERCLKHQIRYVGKYFDEEKLRTKAESKFTSWAKMAILFNKWEIPLMSVRVYDHIPTSFAFPLQEVIERFDTDYFTCGIAYMIAYALFKEYRILNLYGCNMEAKTEWDYQKPCVEYWLGIARGMGCSITITGTWDRPLKSPCGYLYGYDIPHRVTGINFMTRRRIDDPEMRKQYNDASEHEVLICQEL